MLETVLFTFFNLFSTLESSQENPYKMTFEDLANTRYTAATLTSADRQHTPSAITRITADMIRRSGARNLDELLEIYVPNFMTIRQDGSGNHFGIRGIISDIDHKTLLLVNGRNMVNKQFYGALSERKLSMLGDIAYIDVIRGPGSAIHGPGAINGVIDIHTHNADSFEGTKISLRQGSFEEYSSFQFQLAEKIEADSGFYLFYGIDNYDGAKAEYAPLHYSHTTALWQSSQSLDPGFRDNAAYGNRPRHKFHLQFNSKDFEAWFRWTRGSEMYLAEQNILENRSTFSGDGRAIIYQQFTWHLQQKFHINDQLGLTLSGGFDIFDAKQNRPFTTAIEHFGAREEELNIKAMFDWNITEGHQLAFGGMLTRESFGRDTGVAHSSRNVALRQGDSPWWIRTQSLLGEYQWSINEALTLFLGGRADNHTYTDWEYSPRASLVFTPDKERSFYFTYNRSVRRTDDSVLRQQHLNDSEELGKVETIDSYELGSRIQLNQNWKTALTLFYYESDVIGFLPMPVFSESLLGEMKASGFEWELEWSDDEHRLTLAHAYTQLLNFRLFDDQVANQVITAEPYGYGDDFHNWSPHLSSLVWQWNFAEGWEWNSSLRLIWGFPGAEDYAKYNDEVLNVANRTLSDGDKNAFNGSAFLNCGLAWQVNDRTRLQMDAHNILGWIDKGFNKRNYYARMGGWRSEAAAISIGFEYSF